MAGERWRRVGASRDRHLEIGALAERRSPPCSQASQSAPRTSTLLIAGTGWQRGTAAGYLPDFRLAADPAPLVMQTDRTIYFSLAELADRYRHSADPAETGPLAPFELCCFSQHGEDGVIAEILHRVGVAGGWFVEFGIESGREGNCVFLADVLDWSGLFIEADEKHYACARPQVRDQRPGHDIERLGDAGERADTVRTGPSYRESRTFCRSTSTAPTTGSGRRYDDYHPRAVVIEYNPTLPPGRLLVQPVDHAGGWSGTDFFGASLDALAALADRRGYRLVHTDLAAANAFFVRKDLAPDSFQAAADAPRRSEPNYFMQGYHHPADRAVRRYVDLGSSDAVDEPGRREDLEHANSLSERCRAADR